MSPNHCVMNYRRCREELRTSGHKKSTTEKILLLLVESGMLYCTSAVRLLRYISGSVSDLTNEMTSQLVAVVALAIRLPEGTLGDLYRPMHAQLSVRVLCKGLRVVSEIGYVELISHGSPRFSESTEVPGGIFVRRDGGQDSSKHASDVLGLCGHRMLTEPAISIPLHGASLFPTFVDLPPQLPTFRPLSRTYLGCHYLSSLAGTARVPCQASYLLYCAGH